MKSPKDFTLNSYFQLLSVLKAGCYLAQVFEDFLKSPAPKAIILRHDVDKRPESALTMARTENAMGVSATYFFRATPDSFNEAVMTQIKELGHEIGYHYEDMVIANGDPQKAIRHFEYQLGRFRKIYPVKTICMHGSPLSRHDNRDLWRFYDYHDYGVIGEPYFDVDFTDVFYITDTGRKWNHSGYCLRDRVENGFDIPIKSTAHLIKLAEQDALPQRIMITIHPQRWFDFGPSWVREFIVQNLKNIAKAVLIQMR